MALHIAEFHRTRAECICPRAEWKTAFAMIDTLRRIKRKKEAFLISIDFSFATKLGNAILEIEGRDENALLTIITISLQAMALRRPKVTFNRNRVKSVQSYTEYLLPRWLYA